MATVTKTIGATARDYATIALWEAALNGASGGAGNDAVGECYDDATPSFTAGADIDDGTPDSILLTVASGHKHDGTPGSGVHLQGNIQMEASGGAGPSVTIEWLEIDLNGGNVGVTGILYGVSLGGRIFTFRNCLLHGWHASRGYVCAGIRYANACKGRAYNNIIWDITNSNSTAAIRVAGIYSSSGAVTYVYNNTITDLDVSGVLATAHGIYINDDSDHIYKNNLVTDITASGGGTATDYSDDSPANATTANNLSEDASSPDAAFRNKTVTFENAGSEDYHLAAGDADAIDDGEDLGAVANIDIDARDRDAQGDTWDIGAHEYVSLAVHRKHYILGGGIAA